MIKRYDNEIIAAITVKSDRRAGRMEHIGVVMGRVMERLKCRQEESAADDPPGGGRNGDAKRVA
ncbi:MAG: hypothetical protein AB1646_21895 [Thermodesulfobacteriota bacterium]